MMNKITLLFAALMMTLGVSAQVERPAGYFPFPTEVISKTEITSEAELAALMQATDSMNRRIVIQHNHGLAEHDHDGMYMSIDSKMNGNFHKITVHELCSGLSIFTLGGDATNGYTLATVHEGNYIGELAGKDYYNTNGTARNYKFEYVEGKGFYITSDYKSYTGTTTRCLCAGTEDGTVKLYGENASYYPKDGNHEMFFKVYKVNETKGTTDYVKDARVKLIGPGGNVFETLHSGWSDFYEFIENANDTQAGENYAVELTNVKYHEESNEITGSIRFPFSVTGRIAQIPVHLNPSKNVNLRVSTNESEDGYEFVTVGNEGVFANKRNQWYIRPVLDGSIIKYSIQSATDGGKYIYTPQNSLDVTLSDEPTYFKLEGQTSGGKLVALRFTSLYTNPSTNYTTTSYLYNKNQTLSSITNRSYDVNFLVTRVSGEEAGGYDAIGFTRTYHSDTYFWDGGEIAIDDAPADLKAVFEDENHEGYDTEGSKHRIYTANTGIYVPKMGDVTVTFKYLGGGDRLTILGVDIVDALGDIVSSEYHLGYAGDTSSENEYLVKDVPVGNYFLRYWICNRTDYEDGKNHNLSNNSGQIIVEGADYYLTYSDAPMNGAFSSNSTWYRMRLSDGLEKYISAQPNYVDAANNLKLSNNTPPNDYAGLWAIVGDVENGYKFYNRAWGPEYAMKTVGENDKARTYMVPVAEASTYDIVQQDRSQKDYKFYVKLHGTDNNYLNDHGNSRYLATWTGGGLGNSGSVMTFETLNMEVFEANTTIVKNNLIANWNPWVGNPKVSEFVASISDSFAQLMLKRNDFSILNGKVFKFVNKAEEGDARRGRVLRVDANNNMAGVVSQGDLVDDFLQIVDNGKGTFKLLHLATNKYFQSPSAHTITENAADAAAYSYKVYGDEVQALCFISGNEMMHLGNWGYDYTTINENDIAAGASRWDVIYNADAQKLADLIARAKARYAETQEAAYQANVGVPGYANADSTTALLNTFNGGLAGKTFADATYALEAAMKGVSEAEKAVFFPTDCYFTITNRSQSVIFDKNYTSANCNDDYLWCTTSVKADSLNHLWGFYYDDVTNEYYLYNVGKVLFANSKGKGEYGDTWIFSSAPVAIKMEAMDTTPYFHIMGDGKTMSVSEGYVGPVITHDVAGDQGIPMQFNKSTVEFNEDLLEQLEALSRMQLKPGFYTLNCGENYYLNDDVESNTMRKLTSLTKDKIKNIFYLTEDQELVGYSSGYGFTYANCNTGTPEVGYNTFTFSKAAEDGKYLVKADDGKSVKEWADRYLTAVDGKLIENEVKKYATAWTIEAVTELPVKFNNGKDGYAYSTLYSPVALTISNNIEAFTGTVQGQSLILNQLNGTIPAGVGVILRTKAGPGTYTLDITTETQGDTGDLVGDVFTQKNEGATYYSLNMVEDKVAFYKYTGSNLNGFRARLKFNNSNVKQLNFSFNNTTDIEDVISAFQHNAVYDLCGRRVTTPTKGLYIINGKKVFIK